MPLKSGIAVLRGKPELCSLQLVVARDKFVLTSSKVRQIGANTDRTDQPAELR
jgi:hypothetical protein